MSPGRVTEGGTGGVSVIVPCYNYGHFLDGCVASVLGQDGVDVSVLIIDDASTDDSADVGQELAARDPRVEFRRHEVNKGHIATYNEGLAWAGKKYTVLLSADDMLVPGSLRRAVRLLDAHPEVGFVYGRPVLFTTGRPLPGARTGDGRWRIRRGADWLEVRCRTAAGCIASPEVVVRTELQHQLGGYRETLPTVGDIEMWNRFAAHADVGYIAGADQAYYRIHPTSMYRRRTFSPIADLRERKTAFDALFAEHRDCLDEAERLEAMASRALAREALWWACRAYDRRRLETTPVDELVEFANATYAGVAGLRELASLRWRMRAGPRLCPMLQPLLLGAAVRRVRSSLGWKWRVMYGI